MEKYFKRKFTSDSESQEYVKNGKLPTLALSPIVRVGKTFLEVDLRIKYHVIIQIIENSCSKQITYLSIHEIRKCQPCIIFSCSGEQLFRLVLQLLHWQFGSAAPSAKMFLI
jgi:hypothetical protein